MAVEAQPAFLQAGSYGAEQTRRAIYALMARGSNIGSVVGGLINPGDCALSPPGSGMSVNVAPGEMIVPGSSSATQSGYYARVTSSSSLSIAGSDPTDPRIDTVIAQVQDAAYAGSNNSFQLAVVTGTPTGGATLSNLTGKGSIPASSLVLGYVLVPANATNIVGGDLLTTASVASLSPVLAGFTPVLISTNVTAAAKQAVIVTGASAVTVTLPSHLAGQTVVVVNFSSGGTTVSGTDIRGEGLSGASSLPLGTVGSFVVLLDDGTNWNVIGGQQDTGWVAPTLNSGFTSQSGGYAVSYRLQGDTVHWRGAVNASTTGTIVTLPSSIWPASKVFVPGGLITITNAGVMATTTAAAAEMLDGFSYPLS